MSKKGTKKHGKTLNATPLIEGEWSFFEYRIKNDKIILYPIIPARSIIIDVGRVKRGIK